MDVTGSYYWVFDTPIEKSWIASEEVRNALEVGANGKTELSDEMRSVLVSNIRGECTVVE